MVALTWKSEPSLEKRSNALQAIGWQVNLHPYSWSPPTDVYETDASFIVRVEVAGMREADFSIGVEKNFLVISGVRIDAQERRAYHQMEIRFGEFSAAVELPPAVDVNRADAGYEDGFLTVILPKLKPAAVKVQG
ncbi:MAG: heat shock protein Hsp20 family protein [Anaerolineaceae bacterium]|nr:MAG: heat shock protein Hsp20 family protein [Anaerolineaceae bacterium]